MEKLNINHEGRIQIDRDFYLDVTEVPDDRTTVDLWLRKSSSETARYITSMKKKRFQAKPIQEILPEAKLRPMMSNM